jgi:hypothetical protein
MKLYLDGWQPTGMSEPLVYGSLWHKLLELLYNGVRTGRYRTPKKSARLLLKSFMPKWEKSACKEWWNIPKIKEKLALMRLETEVLLPLYCEYWSTDFVRSRWEELEGVFDVQWGGYRLRGRRDGLQNLHGGRWLLETKTKGKYAEEIMRALLRFDFQNLFYITAHEADEKNGCPVEGVTYNMIRKPQIKPKQGEDLPSFRERLALDVEKRPEFYFIRKEATYGKKQRRKFREDLSELLREFKLWRTGELATRRATPAICEGRFTCKYLELCSSGNQEDYTKDARLFVELMD